MNPSKEEEGAADSNAVQDKQESGSTVQETARPPTQSGGDTSSSSSSSSGTLSLATLQKIAASFGEGNVPEFIKTQIKCLSMLQKPKPGLPPLIPSPKKPIRAPPKSKPEPDPDPDPDSDSDPDSPFLFDIFVTNCDCLPIAYEVAMKHFPASVARSAPFTERKVQLTDPLNRLWPNIAYVCFDDEEAFILTKNWAQYAAIFNLKLMDTVRFLKPSPRLGPNHFVTQHFPWPESEPVTIRLPEFPPQNFLFQVELRKGDVGFGRLVIGVDQVRLHFPGIRPGSKREMVKLTDYHDKDWFVMLVYLESGDRYMMIDGWERFVKEHELGAEDQVRFYKPEDLAHDKHFLVQFVKRANPGQSGGGSKDKVTDISRIETAGV